MATQLDHGQVFDGAIPFAPLGSRASRADLVSPALSLFDFSTEEVKRQPEIESKVRTEGVFTAVIGGWALRAMTPGNLADRF